MTISHGNSTKSITLYPHEKPSLEFEKHFWFEHSDEEVTQPLLTLEQDATFKENIEYDYIYTTLTNTHDEHISPHHQVSGKHFLETCSPTE